MAAPVTDPNAPVAEAPEGGGGKKALVPILITVAALLVGAGIGGFVVAPRLSGPAASAEGKDAKHEKKGGAEGAAPKLVKLENVIVNPADAQGQRFLVASLAFEMPNEEAEKKLRESDIQFRDAVIGVLERKTLGWLMQVGARDSLRRELAIVAAPFVGGDTVKVYVPQFLIQ
ncbi:MAG: flagellar basal body-associated FliL family protein [Gemmatimonadota bacterium]